MTDPGDADLREWKRVSLASVACSTAREAREAAGTVTSETPLWAAFRAYMLSMRTDRPAREIRELTAKALWPGERLTSSQRTVLFAHVTAAMVRTEDFADLLAYCADEINNQHEAPFTSAWAYTIRAIANTGIGKPLEAAADAHHAMDLMRDQDATQWIGACSALLDGWIELSAYQDATELLERCDLMGALPDHVVHNYVLHSRGKLRLCLGDPAGALADQLECARRLAEWGATNPAMLLWRSYAALAHLALGDRTAAIRLSDEEVRHARAWGTPRALGLALATRAALSWHNGGELLLKEATRCLAPWDVPGVSGLAPRAFAMIRACGAASLAAQLELAIMGAEPSTRSRPLNQLVDLALKGQSNTQIARGLAVTTQTVEFHFTRIYRKLGITRRADLATAVRTKNLLNPHPQDHHR